MEHPLRVGLVLCWVLGVWGWAGLEAQEIARTPERTTTAAPSLSNPWTTSGPLKPFSSSRVTPATSDQPPFMLKRSRPTPTVLPPASLPVPRKERVGLPQGFLDRPVESGVMQSRSLRPHTTVVQGSGSGGGRDGSQGPVLAALDPSPEPVAQFLGLEDNGTTAAPDTSGAVGPFHVLTVLNSGVRAHDREGNTLGDVSLDDFFRELDPDIFVYDPRCLYDPASELWMVSGAANPDSNNPGLVIAVSLSNDPLAEWYRYFFPLNPPGGVYALSPTIGFNRHWVVIQADLFDQVTGAFVESQILAISKLDLYGGLPAGFARFELSGEEYGGGQIPATVLDPVESRLPLVKNWTGYDRDPGSGRAEGFLRVFMLEGTVGQERLYATNFVGTAQEGLTTPMVWADALPNAVDLGAQKGSATRIQLGDSRMTSVIFRGGSLWCAQMIYVPALNPTRASVQWWEIFPDGRLFQRHQVDDTTGGWSYAYPSIAVNNHYDVLMGYNAFSSTVYPGARYRFYPNDGLNNQPLADRVLKAGEGSYVEIYNDRNLWGDWSVACIDPVNDGALWTLQEYAMVPSPQDTGRFGVWWAQVVPPHDLHVSMTASTNQLVVGQEYQLNLVVSNRVVSFGYDVVLALDAVVGARVISATSTQAFCRVTNGAVYCEVPYVGVAPVRASVRLVAEGSALQWTNTVRVESLGSDLGSANDTATVVLGMRDGVPLVDPELQPLPGVAPVAGHLRLAWPVGYLGFVVESTDRLDVSAGEWRPVTMPVQVGGGQRYVDVPVSGQSTVQFFRLRRP